MNALSRILLVTSLSAGFTYAQATLRAPDLYALPGQTVTVPVILDNQLGDLQGWSFTCNIESPLVIVSEAAGSTTIAFNGGAGPDFLPTAVYPGQGFTVGAVISFVGAEILPTGNDYEIHTCQVTVPAAATPGTVYPITFQNPALGSPTVPAVVVFQAASYAPTLVAGSITVSGTPGVFTTSGNGCPAAVIPVMSLSVDVPPVIGTTMTVTCRAVPSPSSSAVLMLGSAPNQSPAVDLTIIGMPGCTLYVNNIFQNDPMMLGATDATVSYPFPNDPSSVGASITMQAAVFGVTFNALGLVLSDLGSMTLGDY